MTRYFAIDEANARLAEVLPLLEQLKADRDEVARLQPEIERGQKSNGSAEHAEQLAEMEVQQRHAVRRMQDAVSQIDDWGITLRDINTGLIDFPALASGSAEKVADLYAPDAVLLPFNTNDIRTGRPDLVDYYERFLLNYPVANVEQQRVDIPDTHTATDTGVLSFVLHQEGKEPVVRARYTVMYAKAGDKWLIINHHLSQLVTSQ